MFSLLLKLPRRGGRPQGTEMLTETDVGYSKPRLGLCVKSYPELLQNQIICVERARAMDFPAKYMSDKQLKYVNYASKSCTLKNT